MKLKETGDNWGWICSSLVDPQDHQICYEDGTFSPLTTSSVVMDFWEKYKGRPLSEIDSIKDLNWLVNVAIEKQDTFAEMMFNRRLKELQ